MSQSNPSSRMAAYFGYIVYMTYNLQGQWDTNGNHSQPGCANGYCIRSHANYTINSLSTITRAGVPACEVGVGVSRCGGSFLMAKAPGQRPTTSAASGIRSQKGGQVRGTVALSPTPRLTGSLNITNTNVETWCDETTMANPVSATSSGWRACTRTHRP